MILVEKTCPDRSECEFCPGNALRTFRMRPLSTKRVQNENETSVKKPSEHDPCPGNAIYAFRMGLLWKKLGDRGAQNETCVTVQYSQYSTVGNIWSLFCQLIFWTPLVTLTCVH